jgi:hypothetical protein
LQIRHSGNAGQQSACVKQQTVGPVSRMIAYFPVGVNNVDAEIAVSMNATGQDAIASTKNGCADASKCLFPKRRLETVGGRLSSRFRPYFARTTSVFRPLFPRSNLDRPFPNRTRICRSSSVFAFFFASIVPLASNGLLFDAYTPFHCFLLHSLRYHVLNNMSQALHEVHPFHLFEDDDDFLDDTRTNVAPATVHYVSIGVDKTTIKRGPKAFKDDHTISTMLDRDLPKVCKCSNGRKLCDCTNKAKCNHRIVSRCCVDMQTRAGAIKARIDAFKAYTQAEKQRRVFHELCAMHRETNTTRGARGAFLYR